MNSTYLRIIFVFTDLVLPLVAGYYLKKKGIMHTRECNLMMMLNIVGLCTILTFLSFWALHLSLQLLWLPILGILFTILPGIFGELFFARAFTDYLEHGAYIVSCMLSNIGILAGLSAFILYGETGYAYVQLVATPQNILTVILCFPIGQYFAAKQVAQMKKQRLHLSLREMLLTKNQIPVLAMLAGIILQLNGVARPQFLETVFKNMVHFGAWFALLPVGFLIDFGKAKEFYRRVSSQLILRFALMPALFYLMMRHFLTDSVLLGTIIICAAAPTGINAVITSQMFKLKVDLSIASFLLNTVVYLVVFPLFFFYVVSGGSI
jgi:predicted permease